MITFLWMLYLAFALFSTIKTLHWVLVATFKPNLMVKSDEIAATFGCILISLLWSIWYFYYLN
jgi:hypothetical protein